MSQLVTSTWVKFLRARSVIGGSLSWSQINRLLLSSSSRNFAKSTNANYEPVAKGGNGDRDRENGGSEEVGESGDLDHQVKNKKKESITERLMRMSMESADDYVPQQRRPITEDYSSRFEKMRDSKTFQKPDLHQSREPRHSSSASSDFPSKSRHQFRESSQESQELQIIQERVSQNQRIRPDPRRPSHSHPRRPHFNTSQTPHEYDELDGAFIKIKTRFPGVSPGENFRRLNPPEDYTSSSDDQPKPFRRVFKDMKFDQHNLKKSKDFAIDDSILDGISFSEEELSQIPRPPELLKEVDQIPKEDDGDTFGTLSVGGIGISPNDEESVLASKDYAKTEQDLSIFAEREADDYIFVPEDRWSDRKLKLKVKELIAERKLTEALDVFMGALKDKSYIYDKYYLSYIFALVMIECAKMGHVEMTFRLFRDYIKRGFKVKPQHFTYLINACANSPWSKEENLKRIGRLRENMKAKGFLPNEIHYHAMIKAYGRNGDIQAAFSIVDEMMNPEEAKRLRPNQETFAFLLQACISQPENGFRHALITWMKMNQMRLRPTIYTYNLFLRAIRECGIQIPSSTLKLLRSEKRKMREIDVDVDDKTKSPAHIENFTTDPRAVNSITENSVVLDLVSIDDDNPTPRVSELKELFINHGDIVKALGEPENRLALLGGIKAILNQMKRDRVEPDLKTATEFLQIVPIIEISDAFAILQTHKLKPDIHFFNLLIKRYMLAHRVEEGQAVLQLMAQYNLSPNVMTWGVLAIGCSSWTSAKVLLQDMDSANLVPNKEIMGALLTNACLLYDPRYVLRIMEEMNKREMKPNQKFLKKLEEFRSRTQEGIVDAEMGKELKSDRLKLALSDQEFIEFWLKFKQRYRSYMKNAMKDIEEVQDPWAEDYKMRKLNLKKHELP